MPTALAVRHLTAPLNIVAEKFNQVFLYGKFKGSAKIDVCISNRTDMTDNLWRKNYSARLERCRAEKNPATHQLRAICTSTHREHRCLTIRPERLRLRSCRFKSRARFRTYLRRSRDGRNPQSSRILAA